jgi:putative aminopeptidase FrvX
MWKCSKEKDMLLDKLSNLDGAAGDEGEVRRFIKKRVEPYVDSVEVDAIGNLICFKNGKKKKPVVIIAAHMDEVGFMITSKKKDGSLRFAKVGGIDTRVILGKAVRIGKKGLKGVIGVKPIHLLKEDEREKIPKDDELYIDIGATSDSDCEEINIGDYAYFDTNYQKISRNVVKGKAFDDRAGCSIILDMVRENFLFPLFAVFTTQEEVGLRGAKVIGNRIKANYALILEGTGAGDFPVEKDISRTPYLGKGPALTVMDRSMIADIGFLQRIKKVAERENIPYQIKQPGIGGTDAGGIQISRQGVKCSVIAVPARYIHSPVSILNLKDYKDSLKLATSVLRDLEKLEGK